MAANLNLWVESLGWELHIGSYTDLVESDYIITIQPKDRKTTVREDFSEGILLEFREGLFGGDALTAKADEHRASLGAVGLGFVTVFGW